MDGDSIIYTFPIHEHGSSSALLQEVINSLQGWRLFYCMDNTTGKDNNIYNNTAVMDRRTLWGDTIRDFLRTYFAATVPVADRGNADKIDYSITRISQSRWTAALIACGASLFSGNDLCRDDYSNDNNNINNTGIYNRSVYDISKINLLADIYIYLCYDYDKAVNVTGFLYLANISRHSLDTLLREYEKGGRVTANSFSLRQKLREAGEETLSAKLATGKVNPVAILGILNHQYEWSMPGVTREMVQRSARAASELPTLGNSNDVPALPDAGNV